jgi:hypothetical protein
MIIKCTRDVLIQGTAYEAGSVVEVTEKIALQLINMGKAQPDGDDAAEKKDRAVGLTTKSAAPLLKRGAKKKAK